MPVTNAPPPALVIPIDNNWHQLEEVVIVFAGWTRTLKANDRVRIRHIWTGGAYEYEPPTDIEFTIFLPAWYNKIDVKALPGAGGLRGEVFITWS